MVVSIEVPRLGLHMQRARLAEWYLPDGAQVESGEAVCRIETDNIAVELEAESPGILRHRRSPGVSKPAEDVLGVVLAPGERMPEFAPGDEFESQPRRPATEPGEPSKREWEMAVQLLHYWPGDGDEPPPLDEAFEDEAPVAAAETGEAQPPAGTSEPEQPQPEPSAHGFELLSFPGREREQGDLPESWGPVPGDSVVFETELFEKPAETAAETETEDEAPLNFAEALSAFTAGEGAGAPASTATQSPSPGRVSWEAWAAKQAGDEPSEPRNHARHAPDARQTLTMRVNVELAEVAKLRAQLEREWQRDGLRPGTGDVAVRAVARAMAEAAIEKRQAVALRAVFDGGETMRTLHRANSIAFREAVAAMSDGGGTFEDIACVVSVFDEVDDVSPRLRAGDPVAFALGAEHDALRLDGERTIAAPQATLTLAYDPTIIDDAAAARLLGRVRELLEAPYALLAA